MADISGQWRVKVAVDAPWWFRLFNLTRDKKVFTPSGGYNVAFGFVRWGKFSVQTVRFSTNTVLLLYYTDWPIEDRLFSVEAREILGNFYLGAEYVGTFKLLRIEEK